jgi:hypothetical protein
VHQANVEIVGAKFLAETIQVGAGGGRIARPSLGQHGYLVSRHVFERFRHVRMTSVGVGGVEETQAMVVAIEQQGRQAINAQRGLVRVMTGAHRTRTHSQSAGFDPSLSDGDRVVRAELSR